MFKRSRTLLFGVVAVFQLGALGWMIHDQEQILVQGTVYRFLTAPIDPRDPFRGEYVILNFAAETGSWPLADGAGNTGNTKAFGVLGKDSAGFAQITSLVNTVPEQGDYLAVTYMTWGSDTAHQIALPFDRYYLKEGDGATTEKVLQAQWNTNEEPELLPAYAKVRVLNGKAVIEDLIIDGKPVKEWLTSLVQPGDGTLSTP